jgi:uncharacterized protein YigE (DUF2233 family)
MPPPRHAIAAALLAGAGAGAAAAVLCGCRPHARGTATTTTADAAPADDSAIATVEGETFRVRSWSFPLATTRLSLVDLGMHAPLTDALSPSTRLAINAAFFDPDGRSIGLAVSAGKQLSPYSPTLSGGVLYVQDGRAHLEATETFDPKTPLSFAVQCRPRLVVDARPNVSRDDGHHTDRTALCIRDDGATLDVIIATQGPSTPGPSLYALSHYLTTQHPCAQALNLDGGPSTGFAARTPDSSTPAVVWPRGPLRYAVAIE